MLRRNAAEKRPFPSLTLLLFIPLLLLAFWLRLHNIEAFSFWTDEGLTSLRSGYTVSEILSNRIIIQEGITTDTHPPLYYLIIHFSSQLFGGSDFAIRFPSTLASILLLPLMIQFGRRLGGKKLGAVVGILTAVNPLQITYAQEARMYTLIVLLAASTSYLLWRMLVTNKWRRYGGQTILLTGLMIYTHYSAVFLIAAQFVFVGWLLWRNGQRRLVGGTAVLLFLITIPLIPLTVPRLFTGAEAAYYPVPPLVIFRDVVQNFSFGTTLDFSAPLIQLLIMGTAVLLFIGFVTLPSWLHRLFLLSYLLAAPVGIALLSIIKPMYLGVRHIMIGSPALLLILAQAIIWLAASMKNSAKNSATSYRKAGWGTAVVVATAVLSLGTVRAIDNLYNDGNYAKDNFRDLIQYIEQNAGENDLIIYNDGILLATHAQYQQRNLPVTAVPIYPRRAPDSMEILPDLAAQYDRIWFLPDPPDDGRDANKQVQTWLDDNLQRLDTFNTFGTGALLQVIVYTTGPTQTAATSSGGQAVLPTTAIEWANYPTLTGFDAKFAQPTSLATLWIDLFWQGDAPNPEQQIRFVLRGDDGQDWVTVERPFTNNPNWASALQMRQSYPIGIPPGTPPGTYELLIQPVGAEVRSLTTVTLAASNRLPDSVKRPFNQPAITFQNGLTLIDTVIPTEVRPGHALPLQLYWQASSPLPTSNLHYNLQIIAPDGSLFRELSGKPAPEWIEQWPQENLLVANTGIYFPPDTTSGRYQIRGQLREGDKIIEGRPFFWPFHNEAVLMGEIKVVPWPLETTLPQNVSRTDAQFGDAIQLYGYDLAIEPAALQLTLYWQALAVPEKDWFVFVHLLNEAGEIVVQRDVIPAEGLRPTQGWRSSELITDAHEMLLPPGLPAGEYRLVVGLFEAETLLRPFVSQNNLPQPDNLLFLQEISLP
jgi:4-amino-4-deoxy-L-arabinose transferase-like glycosyltransferase